MLAILFFTVSSSMAAPADAEKDWQRRSRAPGVVKAVGFDTIQEWADYNFDRTACVRDYQVDVSGRLAGCRTNAWDSRIRASGAGSARFDILSKSSQSGAGSLAIPFGEYYASQFGARDDLWVSWRQRMTSRYLAPYAAEGGKGEFTAFKQIILSQGDIPGTGARQTVTSQSCTEAEIVIVRTPPADTPPYPQGYMECAMYNAFERKLVPGDYAGDARGSLPITRQNQRKDDGGRFNCIYHPRGMDVSGCMVYQPDQWMTFMVHVALGPEGEAVSSVSGKMQPGFVDSTVEIYMAHAGSEFTLLHRQEGVVIPRGQYFAGGDPLSPKSYRAGWGPSDAHPKARIGKLWLLPYMTNKDPNEVTEPAATWYDEVIISRCPIAAPGFPTPKCDRR